MDTSPADLDSILGFLQKTPYDQPSFLATYTSNGVTAALAIVQTSQKYRINPIILLAQGRARARAHHGEDVSVSNGACRVRVRMRLHRAGAMRHFARWLRQASDCLGRALRTEFDLAAGPNMATDGGWAVGKATTTNDGVSVTPTDASTCSLYPVPADRRHRANWK